MTTITIGRSLLEKLYLYWLEDADPDELEHFKAEVSAVLAATTAPEPAAWLARYVGRSGLDQKYVSTDKNLADENDASGKARPLYLHPPATAPDDRHAQELLAQDITIANMQERHAQELLAYQITVDKLRDQLASTPAWHDAPTCAGLWVRRSEYLVDAFNIDGAAVSFLRQDKTTKHLMWYGPILIGSGGQA